MSTATHQSPNQSLFPIIHSDRSRILAARRCHMYRFLKYDWGKGIDFGNGQPHIGGLSPIRESIYRITGSSVHRGLEELFLAGMRAEDQFDLDEINLGKEPDWANRMVQFDQATIDHATQMALEYWRQNSAELDFGLSSGKLTPDEEQWKREEAEALIEGLVRAAGVGIVRELLLTWRVLEVEHEDGVVMEQSGREVQFNSKADAILINRVTGDLVTLNTKTRGSVGYQLSEELKTDAQGLSEPLITEIRLRMDWDQAKDPEQELVQALDPKRSSRYWNLLRSMPTPPVVRGALMMLMLKGRTYKAEWGDGGGNKRIHYSPLTRVWMMDPGMGEAQRQWSWTDKVVNPANKSGYGRLGKGWRAVEVWKYYPGGIKAWVKYLRDVGYDPGLGHPFDQLWHVPEIMERPGWQRERWMIHALAEELEAQGRAERVEWQTGKVESGDPLYLVRMNEASCIAFNSRCEMNGVCWGSLEAFRGPLETGLYRLRVPHHEAEEWGEDD